MWHYKSNVIYLGNEYYGPKMLGVTYSNQNDDFIKNVEIGSRSGMVYGEAVNVEIENQSAQTVAILCRDKLWVMNKYQVWKAYFKANNNDVKTFVLHFRKETKPDICNTNQASGEYYDHFCVLLHNDVQYQVSQVLFIYTNL